MQMLLSVETSGMRSGNIHIISNGNTETFRAVLGDDVHFVGLTLNESECMKRVKSRHDDQPEILEKIRV